MMTIKFRTEKAWYKAIAAMVREGVTFEADDFDGLTITLTGGY